MTISDGFAVWVLLIWVFLLWGLVGIPIVLAVVMACVFSWVTIEVVGRVGEKEAEENISEADVA
jgi:ABC-type bacteriocin/lantibiotic exporter with double-glycine peptidase domain